jgi:hypothetical protein
VTASRVYGVLLLDWSVSCCKHAAGERRYTEGWTWDLTSCLRASAEVQLLHLLQALHWPTLDVRVREDHCDCSSRRPRTACPMPLRPQPLHAGVRHHLIDVLDPFDPVAEYSAGQFHDAAHAAVAEVHARRRTPLVIGGTGFYLRTFMAGKPSGGSAPPEVEARVCEMLRAALLRAAVRRPCRHSHCGSARARRGRCRRRCCGRAVARWLRRAAHSRRQRRCRPVRPRGPPCMHAAACGCSPACPAAAVVAGVHRERSAQLPAAHAAGTC